jgi:integrase
LSKKFPIKRLEQVRDIFIFSCFTGLQYADLANLSSDNIVLKNNVPAIVINRRMTTSSTSIPLLPIPLKILEKYKNQGKSNQLLPLVSNQKINAHLKEIGEICGFKKNLTLRVARQTFASLTLSKGVPIDSVSKMLGHNNIRITQCFAPRYKNSIEEDMTKFAGELSILNDSLNL